MKNFLSPFYFLSLFPLSAFSNTEPKICMVLDKAGKDDHSFNQEAYNGFQKAFKSLPISRESKVIEAKDENHLNQTVRSFVKGKCSIIFAVGINNADTIKLISPQFPEQKFVVIDSNVDKKNVRSIVFRDEQGAFLMGAIAAIKSKTGSIGIIGGMNIPLIQKFETAYTAGAKYVNPKINVLIGYVGISVEAWNNPTKAQEIALSQFDQGADIIFHAAGGSGLGVFNAAEKANKKNTKKYAIGCDSNQNWIKPGMILTSMTKDIEKSVLDTIQNIIDNKFTTGLYTYDISNGGINWALDKYNKELFTEAEIIKINHIKNEIALNKIQTLSKEAKN
ncbi:BMP family protein [Silvanigrella sp.]|jgi:basic membrane protein A|uniref:BMP family protein n=1 Tax=Silvanigrella sp. TaxID=2024976 RepID=UPI0037CBDF44|nr:BMP family ABC transporter substrate-binding protein [Silvanigrellaceae bacterium]